MPTIRVPTDWAWIVESDPKEIASLLDRYRWALEDVVSPMAKLQRDAEAEGARLNGMAYSIANNLGFVKSIARDALKPSQQPQN